MKFPVQVVTVLLSISLAHADTTWKAKANIPKSGPIKSITPTRLRYDISWNGKIKAGTLGLEFGKKDQRYPEFFVVSGHGKSTGWARKLYPATVDYTGILRRSDRRPVQFWGFENERSETNQYHFRFSPSAVNGSRVTTEKGSRKAHRHQSRFNYPQSLELFSGLMQVRSLPLDNGDKIVMPFHPVSKPYLATIKVLAREKHYGRDCIKMDVQLQKIGTDMKLKSYKKLKTATVWLSDDTWRVPIELRAKVYVGDVRVILTHHDLL